MKKSMVKKPQCTCRHCNDDSIDYVATKASNVSDLERDELLIYRAVKPYWNDNYPFYNAMEALTDSLLVVAKGTVKKEVYPLLDNKPLYGIIPIDLFVELPIQKTVEYITQRYMPIEIIPLLEASNTKWISEGKREKVYSESRLLTLCIDMNTDIDTLCKLYIMWSLEYLPDLLKEEYRNGDYR